MKTPKQTEQQLKAGFDSIQIGTPENIRAAEIAFRAVRATYGFKSKGKLLTTGISKLEKNKQITAGLAFPPATSSDLANLCAFSDSCASTCVAFSGNGGFTTTQLSRKAKLEFALLFPEEFALLLFEEIRVLSNNNRRRVAIRLNTYSDLRWEIVAPILFAAFSRVNFYDYTKHTTASRPAGKIPSNYKLTYSVSERTNTQEISKAIDAGRNLAVVVSVRSGTIAGEWRKIPRTWGGIKTVDGDKRDDRHNDPKNRVVILRRKHTMKTNHPMIQQAERLAQ